MIRLMRLNSKDLASELSYALSDLGALLQELNIDSQTNSLIAFSTKSHEQLLFNSHMAGSLQDLSVENGVPKFYQDQLQAAQNYTYRSEKILQALKAKYQNLVDANNTLNIANKERISGAEFLYALISNPQYMVVINNREPVIIPFFTQDHFDKTIQNPQEHLNAVKTLGITSAILASFFASASVEAARIGALNDNEVNQDKASANQKEQETNSSTDDTCNLNNDEKSNIDLDANFTYQSLKHNNDHQSTDAYDKFDSNNNLFSQDNITNKDAILGTYDHALNSNANDSLPSDNANSSQDASSSFAIGSDEQAKDNQDSINNHNANNDNSQEQDQNKSFVAASGCLIPGLIALLLLLALLAFYFFKIYPWPFDKYDEQDLLLDKLNEQVIEDELNLNKINDLINLTQERIDLSKLDEENQKLADLKNTLAKDEKTLQEIERLMALVNQKDEQINKALLEEAKAQEVALKNAQEIALNKDHANNTLKVKLPKCETIVKQGKMPNLIIATDGSGSMLNKLNDGTLRIEASIKAAHALINHVDKNVPIRLFGIQGCPLARDYGTFMGNERDQLKRAVIQTNPFLVKGKLPYEVLTPLVSAMRGMASAAPKNADSIGVLISDGVDTCRGTEQLDLCQVAAQIHKSKPRLKIHVVLIGDEAPDAKCVADITGGKVYRPENTNSLINDLKSAGQSLQKVCQ